MTDAFLSVTNLNEFNGPPQTTNLGVGSSNLSGRANSVQICEHLADSRGSFVARERMVFRYQHINCRQDEQRE